MTPLAIFVLFGLPVTLLALGWGAVFLHGRALDHEQAAEREKDRAEAIH
jgi:hypothetical protein